MPKLEKTIEQTVLTLEEVLEEAAAKERRFIEKYRTWQRWQEKRVDSWRLHG
jgi:hypothetical protein